MESSTTIKPAASRLTLRELFYALTDADDCISQARYLLSQLPTTIPQQEDIIYLLNYLRQPQELLNWQQEVTESQLTASKQPAIVHNAHALFGRIHEVIKLIDKGLETFSRHEMYPLALENLEKARKYYQNYMMNLCDAKDGAARKELLQARSTVAVPELGCRYLKVEVVDYLSDPKNKLTHTGTVPVYAYQGLHFKVNPKKPGLEYAADRLNHWLFQQGSAPSILFELRQGDKIQLVLAAQTIEGKSLDAGFTQNATENLQLSSESFSVLFLFNLLIHANDAKWDNFIITRDSLEKKELLEIIGIDNEMAFFPAIVKYDNEKYFTPLWCSLFFLPQMHEPLSPKIVEQFCQTNIAVVVLQWLADLHCFNQKLEKYAASKLWKLSDYAEKQLPIHFLPQTITRLMAECYAIQELLIRKPDVTAWEIFALVFPEISEFYRKVFEESQLYLENYYIDEWMDKTSGNKYQLRWVEKEGQGKWELSYIFDKSEDSILVKEFVRLEPLTPTPALQKILANIEKMPVSLWPAEEKTALMEAIADYHRQVLPWRLKEYLLRQEVALALLNVSIKSSTFFIENAAYHRWKDEKPSLSFTMVTATQEWLESVDYTHYSPSEQENILRAIALYGRYLPCVMIKDCAVLTDTRLKEISLNLPDLKLLILSECPQVTVVGIQEVEQKSAIELLRINAAEMDSTIFRLNFQRLLNIPRQYAMRGISQCQVDGMTQYDFGKDTLEQQRKVIDNYKFWLSTHAELMFRHCSVLSDADLKDFATFPHLNTITLFDCEQITLAGIDSLLEKHPELHLQIGHCKKIGGAEWDKLLHSANYRQVSLLLPDEKPLKIKPVGEYAEKYLFWVNAQRHQKGIGETKTILLRHGFLELSWQALQAWQYQDVPAAEFAWAAYTVKLQCQQLEKTKANLATWREVYISLPENLRSVFHKQLGNLRQEKLKNQLKAFIASYPTSDGSRASTQQMEKTWQHQVMHLLTRQKPQTMPEIRIGQENAYEYLPEDLIQQLMKEGWLLPNGDFNWDKRQPKSSLTGLFLITKEEEIAGTHLVIPVNYKGVSVYLKICPEFPGMEIAVHLLNHLVMGYGSLPATLWRWKISNKIYPVLVSQAVPGKPLYEIPEALQNLHFASYCRLVILAILTKPEDQQSTNLIAQLVAGSYQLVGIDNDRCFVPPFEETHLRVKTLLYCTDLMHQPVPAEIRQELLTLNPLKLLQQWIAQLKQRQQEITELFCDHEWKSFYEQGDNRRFSLLFALLKKGTVMELFNQLQILQNKLRESESVTLFALLASISVRLANHYQQAHLLNKLPEERFKIATKGEYRWRQKSACTLEIAAMLPDRTQMKSYQYWLIFTGENSWQLIYFNSEKLLLEKDISEIPGLMWLLQTKTLATLSIEDKRLLQKTLEDYHNRLRPTTTLKRADYIRGVRGEELDSRNLKLAWEQDLTLAQKELETLSQSHGQIEKAAQGLVGKDINKMRGDHEPFLRLPGDYYRERAVALIEWDKIRSVQGVINEKRQRWILTQIQRVKYHELHLPHCTVLTGEALLKIVTLSPNLRILDIKDCRNIRENILSEVLESAPQLQKLKVSYTPITEIISMQQTGLQEIIADHCEKLMTLNIRSQYPLHVSANQCAQLTTLQLGNGEKVMQLSLANCAALPYAEWFAKYPILLNRKEPKSIIPLGKILDATLGVKQQRFHELPTFIQQQLLKMLNDYFQQDWLILVRLLRSKLWEGLLKQELNLWIFSLLGEIDYPLQSVFMTALVQALQADGLRGEREGYVRLCLQINKLFSAAQRRMLIPPLLNALKDNNSWRVRANAAQMLGRFGIKTEKLIFMLIAAVKDADSVVRASAIQALGRLGLGTQEEKVILTLISALQDKEVWSVRVSAAEAFARLGIKQERVIIALLIALSDEHEDVRVAAAQGLGALGLKEERIFTALMSLLWDKSKVVRMAAAEALHKLGDREEKATVALLRALGDKADGEGRANAAQGLGALGIKEERVIAALLSALQDESSNVRAAAAQALRKLRVWEQSVINSLLTVLWDENASVRREAAKTLGKSGVQEEKIITVLITVLGDGDYTVREAAVQALGKLRVQQEKVIAALLSTLWDEMSSIRAVAIQALGRIGIQEEKIISALINMLGDKHNLPVRVAAVEALGRLGGQEERVIATFITVLRNDYANVRAAAVEALINLHVPKRKAIDLLMTALKDKDVSVRAAAAQGLGRLGVKQEKVVAALIDRLEDEDRNVRAGVAQALGVLATGEEKTISALLGALGDKENWERHASAAQAIRNISEAYQNATIKKINALLISGEAPALPVDEKMNTPVSLPRPVHVADYSGLLENYFLYGTSAGKKAVGGIDECVEKILDIFHQAQNISTLRQVTLSEEKEENILKLQSSEIVPHSSNKSTIFAHPPLLVLLDVDNTLINSQGELNLSLLFALQAQEIKQVILITAYSLHYNFKEGVAKNILRYDLIRRLRRYGIEVIAVVTSAAPYQQANLLLGEYYQQKLYPIEQAARCDTAAGKIDTAERIFQQHAEFVQAEVESIKQNIVTENKDDRYRGGKQHLLQHIVQQLAENTVLVLYDDKPEVIHYAEEELIKFSAFQAKKLTLFAQRVDFHHQAQSLARYAESLVKAQAIVGETSGTLSLAPVANYLGKPVLSIIFVSALALYDLNSKDIHLALITALKDKIVYLLSTGDEKEDRHINEICARQNLIFSAEKIFSMPIATAVNRLQRLEKLAEYMDQLSKNHPESLVHVTIISEETPWLEGIRQDYPNDLSRCLIRSSEEKSRTEYQQAWQQGQYAYYQQLVEQSLTLQETNQEEIAKILKEIDNARNSLLLNFSQGIATLQLLREILLQPRADTTLANIRQWLQVHEGKFIFADASPPPQQIVKRQRIFGLTLFVQHEQVPVSVKLTPLGKIAEVFKRHLQVTVKATVRMG